MTFSGSQQVLNRYLEDDSHFILAANIGLEAADHGEFVDNAEVWANLEKILQS